MCCIKAAHSFNYFCSVRAKERHEVNKFRDYFKLKLNKTLTSKQTREIYL